MAACWSQHLCQEQLSSSFVLSSLHRCLSLFTMDDKAIAVVAPQERHVDVAAKGDSEAQVFVAEKVSSRRQRLSDIFTIVSNNL
jgi:hypothetical protein